MEDLDDGPSLHGEKTRARDEDEKIRKMSKRSKGGG